MPEEAPEAVELLIQQCLEKEVSRRPSAKQVYDTMQGVLQGEGGLIGATTEPVRVVNTDPTWGSSGTDSTYDSAGSRVSSVGGYGAVSGGYGATNANTGYGAANGNAVNGGYGIANGNNVSRAAPVGVTNGAAGTAAPAGGVRISRGNVGAVGGRV